MGIKNLNRYLSDNCSYSAIRKTNLREFFDKTIVIDTSIYMYKFITQKALIENMYSMITILFSCKITPIFVFDGKPPPEKRDILKQRSKCKKEAEKKYNEMKVELEKFPNSEEIASEMESLKKKFVRIRDDDVKKIKLLMDSLGVLYLDADGESDRLCASMVISGAAWACLSDDMDMFAYGCSRVMRHLSLMKHTVVLYDMNEILNELSLSMSEFRTIAILSGTDYNIYDKFSIKDTISYYYDFKRENSDASEFYNWLIHNSNFNLDIDHLNQTYNMFCIDNVDIDATVIMEFPYKKANAEQMRALLKNDGFVFI